MASVRKRTYKDKSVRWVVDFQDGDGKRVLKTFEHKKSADAFRNSIVQEVQAGRYVSKASAISWPEATATWIEMIRARARIKDKMTNGCVINYERALERLQPHFRKKMLHEITTELMQAAIDGMLEKFAPASVRAAVAVACNVAEFAIENRQLRALGFNRKRLRLPPLSRKPQIPPKAALRAILAKISNREPSEIRHVFHTRAVIITLALFGGLRRGEICGLAWADVDLVARTVSIRKSQSRTDGLKAPKTKAGYRTVPLAPPAFQALVELHRFNDGANVGEEDRVVLTYKGRPMDPSSIYADHWRIILERAGLVVKGERTPYRFHSLRHAAVSLLIEQKLSPFHIKSMIGHASVTTTLDVYGHMFPADDSIAKAAAAAAASLDATYTQHDSLSH